MLIAPPVASRAAKVVVVVGYVTVSCARPTLTRSVDEPSGSEDCGLVGGSAATLRAAGSIYLGEQGEPRTGTRPRDGVRMYSS